jgi:hypothetical protein
VLKLGGRLIAAIDHPFAIEIPVISEPPPAPDTPREVFAKHFPDAPGPFPFLCFIFFVLDAV